MNPLPPTLLSRIALSRAYLAGFAFSVLALMAQADPIISVGVMRFVDEDTVVVADWRAGQLHALQLPPTHAGTPAPFNLKNVSAPIARALRTEPDKVIFEDLAFRPGKELAYVSVSVIHKNAAPTPALVAIDAAGKVEPVNLEKVSHTSAAISHRPSGDKKFWRDVPEATLTVTSMVYDDHKLYVAGLSNATFASTLRVYDFPFNGTSTATSVEMYHAVHNQTETRAPIRTMAMVSLHGEPALLAAYTCTPLVVIPLKDLKDGAHVVGKTIAELGWGSAPVDMVTFDAGAGPAVLVTHTHKAADLMPVSTIAEAAEKPGLSTPISWPDKPLLGLKSTYVPIARVAQLDSQDKDFLGALRRDEATGAMQLVSMRKGAFLRLSDFVNEYDFADFQYGPNDPFRDAHRQWRNDEGYPDLAAKAAR